MSRSFTKLFSSITESTVWCEPTATRIAWITMLAMADRHGRVWASVPGLANRARITIEETETALERFLAPDPYSRTPDHEGRRIEVIDGGWRLLNYEKYRALRDEDERRVYQRAWDREHRSGRVRNPTNPTDSDRDRPGPTQAEAEAEALNSKALSGKKPPDDARTDRSDPKAKARQQARASAARAIEYLNARAGTRFKAVEPNLKLPAARILQDSATEADLLAVVDLKVAEAERGEFDRKYLRPATLWNAEKFSQYVGLVGARAPAADAVAPTGATVYFEYEDGRLREMETYPATEHLVAAKLCARDYATKIAIGNVQAVAVKIGPERRRFTVQELTQ